MKLIVGLGNPGKEYENTKHNMGFKVVDHLVDKLGIKSNEKSKFNALYYEYFANNEKFILMKPQTYMNLSGDAVASFAAYFDIDTSDVIVIYDDKDLSFIEVKVKFTGSAGGHNGMKDIINKLHTDQLARIKVGISYNKNYLIKDWVLSNFSNNELNQFILLYNKIDLIFDPLFKGQNLTKIISKINFKKVI